MKAADLVEGQKIQDGEKELTVIRATSAMVLYSYVENYPLYGTTDVETNYLSLRDAQRHIDLGNWVIK